MNRDCGREMALWYGFGEQKTLKQEKRRQGVSHAMSVEDGEIERVWNGKDTFSSHDNQSADVVHVNRPTPGRYRPGRKEWREREKITYMPSFDESLSWNRCYTRCPE
jgi:hypothetical protein